MIRACVWFGLALALVLGTAGRAEAYPQWQFSSGTSRCAQCHFSPAGGGIITGYARDAVGEELSTLEGNGAFLHGGVDLPAAVALQFDGRMTALWHDTNAKTGPRTALFPMQADLSARFRLSDAVSFVGVVGWRGQARASDEVLGPGAAKAPEFTRIVSREHYLMWRPEAMGVYVRAGRFFAPFGLRLAEHNLYVRRDTGFNLLEESYNLSLGWVESGWELHLTGFAPDFLRQAGSDEYGGTALFELRAGDASAIGLQARGGFKTDRNRFTGGVFGKTWVEPIKLLLQTELNLIHSITSSSVSSQSFVGYLGATFIPARGFWLTPFGERIQTSLSVRDSATNAGGLQINWFPYPHFELVVQGRAQMPTSSNPNAGAMTALAFLHYYL